MLKKILLALVAVIGTIFVIAGRTAFRCTLLADR